MYSQYSSARSGVLRILRSNLRTAAVVMVTCLSSLTGVHAAPITVNPGDTLEVNFRFTQPFLAPPNILEVSITPVTPLPTGSFWDANFTLYNGSTQLLTWGGGSGPGSFAGFAIASDMPSGCGSVCLDFTSIRNGTINGRWDISPLPSTRPLTFDPALAGAVRIDAGVSGGSVAPTLANISSITLNGIVVYTPPPPTYYGLFIGAKALASNGSGTVPFDTYAAQMAGVFLSRPNSSAEVLLGDATPNSSGNPRAPITVQDISNALGRIFSKMKNSNDVLIIYISDHGGSQVPLSGVFNADGHGDEVIYTGDWLWDNTLASLLQRFAGHQIWVFLDSCHGGGFWGGTDSAEYGPLGRGFNDLNQLNNVALYSGADESFDEYGSSLFGMSFWGVALLNAMSLPVQWSQQGLSYYLTTQTLSLAYATIVGVVQTPPVWYSRGLGDPVPADMSLIRTFDAHSSDFDVNAPLMSAPDPGLQMGTLLTAVRRVGPGASLANKVKEAQKSYAVPDLGATCGVLTGFVNEVKAQTGKKISQADAFYFTTVAEGVMSGINCH